LATAKVYAASFSEKGATIGPEPDRRIARTEVLVAQRLFAASLVFALVGACYGQRRADADSDVAMARIMSVLSKAKVSGSLEYWGHCDNLYHFPDFPVVSPAQSNTGTPLEVLREMFSNDPKMQVTQDPDGMIRMAEADVPSDLLNVTISHISFDKAGTSTITAPNGNTRTEPTVVRDPNAARSLILAAPEVSAFMSARNIGWPPYNAEAISFLETSASPRITGDLENVTLSQALDYVLKAIPGLWVYENCPSKTGKRIVYFKFYSNGWGWENLIKRP
jgi:hypothetical protein